MFDRVVCINLDRRPDRWEEFQRRLAVVTWPFKPVERFSAVDGHAAHPPDWWKQGGGAWGCLMSHARIMEECLRDNVESVLILEDDAVFVGHFDHLVKEFLDAVPADWDQLYLGGQHLRSPDPEGAVLRCKNVNRTHAYAMRRKFLHRAYRWVMNAPDYIAARGHHIDHRYGALCETGTVQAYAPTTWLVGQAANRSDISGRDHPTLFWGTPDSSAGQPFIVVLDLHCGDGGPKLAGALKSAGVHFGHNLRGWKEPQVEDTGLSKLCETCLPFPAMEKRGGSAEATAALHDWTRMISGEAAKYGGIGGACYPTLCALQPEYSKAWPEKLWPVVVGTCPREGGRRLRERATQHKSGWLAIGPQQCTDIQEWLFARRKDWLWGRHLVVGEEEIADDPFASAKKVLDWAGWRPPGAAVS